MLEAKPPSDLEGETSTDEEREKYRRFRDRRQGALKNAKIASELGDIQDTATFLAASKVSNGEQLQIIVKAFINFEQRWSNKWGAHSKRLPREQVNAYKRKQRRIRRYLRLLKEGHLGQALALALAKRDRDEVVRGITRPWG
jgi:hypothetical protein